MRNTRRAFTLVELVVVIGIIAILASLVLVAVSKSLATGRRVRVQADFQAIAMGLEAYKQDFGDYPRVYTNPNLGTDAAHPNPPTADQILCLALIAPLPQTDANPVANRLLMQDGADGPGFRIRGAQGKVYGPYIDLDKFNVDTTNLVIRSKVFASNDANPVPAILYIPKNSRPIKPEENYLAPNAGAMYDTRSIPASIDWPTLAPRDPLWQMQHMMGNKQHTQPLANVFPITNPDTPAFTGPYILWMPGPDGIFGLTNSKGKRDADDGAYITDDIANFSFDPAITVK